MPETVTPPYLDETLPTEARVADALDRLSLAEKIAQLSAVSLPRESAEREPLVREDGTIDDAVAKDLFENGVGLIVRLADLDLDPATTARLSRRMRAFAREGSSLDLPAIHTEECISGYMGRGATTYPQSIGLANTWEPALLEGMTERIREQLRAVGARLALSPVLDIARDPRWGRTEETYGEDPYLVARLGAAFVDGLQGEDPREGVSAMLKHFGGHGVGEGGKNRSAVQLGERELRAVHLFPFEAAIQEANADAVMTAYHANDGVPCTADEWLLTDVLRGEWGFDGTVVSDGASVRFLTDEHRVAATYYDAAIQAIEAGTDVEIPRPTCYQNLREAVESGDVAEQTIDAAVRRVLRQKIERGLLDKPAVASERDEEAPRHDIEDPGIDGAGTVGPAVADAFGPEKHRAYARKLARESITLLKNEADLLPLSGEQSVAILGPKADSPRGQLGDYAYAAHHPEANTDREIVTPLDAFRDRLGEDAVQYAAGCSTTGHDTDRIDDAVGAATEADVAVAFVGARSGIVLGGDATDLYPAPEMRTSGEGGDVTDLELPGVQQDLVEAVQETDTPLVVVQISGKPHSIEWIDDHVPAVLHAWLPGEEGGNGIADVLLGEHTPSGRLPISIPKDVGQLPVYYSRRPNSRNERHVYVDEDPLYPFGHGLSYTDFEYGDVELASDEIAPNGTIEATVTVENVGDRAGHEVVQAYTHQRWPSLSRPVQELRAFERIYLEPGESATVTFEIDATQLAVHDREMNLVVESGAYELRIGASAADIQSAAAFEITGERRRLPRSARSYFAGTSVEHGPDADTQ